MKYKEEKYVNAFDKIVEACRKDGMNSDEILEALSQMFHHVSMIELQQRESSNKKSMEELVQELFQKIGIPSKTKGHKYLLRTVLLFLEKPHSHLVDTILPIVAKEFDVTANSVDRAIRYTIKIGWENCSREIKKEVFGDIFAKEGFKCPTTKQFICLVEKNLSET